MNPVIEIRGMRKRREHGGIKFELEVPEFKVSKGEFVAVVGDSGCGKSTLLDMLALVSEPTECIHFKAGFEDNNHVIIRSFWANNDESSLANIRSKNLGYILQTGGLLPFLSVGENIRLPLYINGKRPDENYLNSIANRIGVRDLFSKKPQFLSGGQRQRVAILRALAHRPNLILADEPTAAVDKNRAIEIIGDLYRLAKEQEVTIIVVTHDQELVSDIADRFCRFKLEQIDQFTTRSTSNLS